ncbi:hypothetical protein [Halomonas sp. BC04]|uniref:hypothetical protein n=1 Tax=Halomonas sp. BC04 TaxID=1403540 RepID=UPI0018CBFD7B
MEQDQQAECRRQQPTQGQNHHLLIPGGEHAAYAVAHDDHDRHALDSPDAEDPAVPGQWRAKGNGPTSLTGNELGYRRGIDLHAQRLCHGQVLQIRPPSDQAQVVVDNGDTLTRIERQSLKRMGEEEEIQSCRRDTEEKPVGIIHAPQVEHAMIARLRIPVAVGMALFMVLEKPADEGTLLHVMSREPGVPHRIECLAGMTDDPEGIQKRQALLALGDQGFKGPGEALIDIAIDGQRKEVGQAAQRVVGAVEGTGSPLGHQLSLCQHTALGSIQLTVVAFLQGPDDDKQHKRDRHGIDHGGLECRPAPLQRLIPGRSHRWRTLQITSSNVISHPAPA